MRLKPSEIGSCWDHQVNRMRALKSLGFNPRSILDIGAYHGSWSEVMWHVWPDAQYHLIEANADCEPELKRTGFKYDIALLSDRARDVMYHKCQTGSGEGNSLYKENSVYPFKSEWARTKRADSILGKQVFDLVKVDAQGAELDILDGMNPQAFHATTVFQLECQIQSYNEGAPPASEVIAYMDNNGFRLFDIGEYHYNSHNMLIQADFIFAGKDSGLFGLKVLT